MGIMYHCANNSCSYPGNTEFEITFKSESILDNNNLAAIFCPFCKKEMLGSIFSDMEKNTVNP